MYQFHLSIGDWSGDGHGRSEDFTVASNAPVEIVREAHFFDLMHTTKETETPADLKNLRVFFVLRHHVLFPKQREIRKNIV